MRGLTENERTILGYHSGIPSYAPGSVPASADAAYTAAMEAFEKRKLVRRENFVHDGRRYQAFVMTSLGHLALSIVTDVAV